MGKIVINLLPPEIAVVEKQKSKRVWVVRISSLVIVIVIAITSFALGFGFVKSGEEKQKQKDLETARSQVASLNAEEGYLTLIKQRLNKISQISDSDSKRLLAFNFATETIQNGITIAEINIAKDGGIALNGKASGVDPLGNLFTSLSDQIDKGKINKVRVDNLSRGADEQYRFDLAIRLK